MRPQNCIYKIIMVGFSNDRLGNAQAIYDFKGENRSEVDFSFGQKLKIIRQDVGDGWWEASNEGKVGLVPASYLQIVSSSSVPSPPAQQDYLYENFHSGSDVANNGVCHQSWDSEWDEYDSFDEESVIGESNSSTHGKMALNDANAKAVSPLKKVSAFTNSNIDNFVLNGAKFSDTTKFLHEIISTGIRISRRYKHFDWLHDRLKDKFSFIAVPPLPEKQVTGRYEEHFIEHRMSQLQKWVDRICIHPVLSQCSVWKHFISCTHEKDWKVGKRKAEKDQYIGAGIFAQFKFPSQDVNNEAADAEIDSFGRLIRFLDESFRSLQLVLQTSCKQQKGPYKRDFLKLSNIFSNISSHLASHEERPSISHSIVKQANLGNITHNSVESQGFSSKNNLGTALNFLKAAFEHIAIQYDNQSKYDIDPLNDFLYISRGMFSSFPDIVNFHKSALAKFKEFQRNTESKPSSISECKNRMNMISYLILAEVDFFKRQFLSDLSCAIKNMLHLRKNSSIKLNKVYASP